MQDGDGKLITPGVQVNAIVVIAICQIFSLAIGQIFINFQVQHGERDHRTNVATGQPHHQAVLINAATAVHQICTP
jgi:hypothetical protein